MDKLETVEYILSESAEIADWYRTEWEADFSLLTPDTIRTYGGENEGQGDLADSIINSGIEDGIISQDDADGFFPAIRNIFTPH